MNNVTFCKIILVWFIVVSVIFIPDKSYAKEKEFEKEKIEFGGIINESTKEVKAAESNYTKTVKTKKYKPRKSKGKKNVKLNIPKETVEAQDSMQWDYNKKEAMKQKIKLDKINTLENIPKK